jgi:hypothetical protein
VISVDDPLIPTIPLIAACLAVMVGAVLYARWSRRRDLLRHRRPPGDPMPDRVWSGEAPGPWLVTVGGHLYEVMPGDLPRGRALTKGFLSNADLRMLADSRITVDRPVQRLFRYERGDLAAAKLVRDTSHSGAARWRIDALDCDGGYRLFGFDHESEARSFLEMLRSNILPQSGDGDAATQAEIDAARVRDETNKPS